MDTAISAEASPQEDVAFELGMPRDEIAATIEPFVSSRKSVKSLGWRYLAMKKWYRRRKSFLKHQEQQRSAPPAQEQEAVIEHYEEHWGDSALIRLLARNRKPSPCVWGDEGLIMNTVGIKRLHERFLVKALDQIKPKNVLEVGCGNGLNLFVVAGRFPDTEFQGVELSQHGAEAAGRIRDQAVIPPELAEFAGELLVDPTAYQRVQVQQGNAKELPFPDNHFDVIYTVLALEAMEEIRHAALQELARVARRYVIMIEPFREYNDRGSRFYHHSQQNYLRARVDELPQDGLEPVHVFTDFPRLLRLRPAFVVARPVGASVVV